jgi:hypothetical protein
MTKVIELTRDYAQCVPQHTEGANPIFGYPAGIVKNANVTYCGISRKKALVIYLTVL